MALAETSPLNMQFPLLKIFGDVNDDTLPRLVACSLMLSRQGVTFEQFIHFLQAVVGETVEMLDQCQQNNWLCWPDEDEDAGGDDQQTSHALH